MVTSGSLDMKDSIGPTTTSVGVGITAVSPAIILQAIGIVIAVIGAFYTRKRWIESQRANDIEERKLALEEKKYAETRLRRP